MFTFRTAARAAFAAAAFAVTAASAADKPKSPPQAVPSAVKSPRDASTGMSSVKAVPGTGQPVSAQKLDGWGVVKGVGNIISGSVKVVRGKVDEGVDQVKHGGEQVKASTDKDDSNNPSNGTPKTPRK